MHIPGLTPLQHTETFQVRTYEIDRHKRSTLPALIRLMHEAAMQNVIALKLSVWDMESRQISWVLRRKQMQLRRLPRLDEQITILTYPAGFDKFFTYRDYRVLDETGDQIAWSASTWILMNTQRRSLVRIPDFILEYAKDMPDPDDCLPRPSGKIPKLEQTDQQRSYKVNFYDLDFNNHLNNTLYIKWMLEALPDEILLSHQLQSLDIQFRAECRWKTSVRSETQELGDRSFLHRLVTEEEGKELASALSEWGKRG